MGRTKRRMEMERPSRTGRCGKNNKRWVWDVDVPLGSNVLETNEKGGAVWEVYVDRNFLDGP